MLHVEQGKPAARAGSGIATLPSDQGNHREISLTAGAVAILTTADPPAKAAASRALAAAWRGGAIALGQAVSPARPSRPARPPLRPPGEMPKRRAFGSRAGRIALLHALAHIELNAIDLAWDLLARFSGEDLPPAFFDGWVGVAAEEACHFELLAGRLGDFGAAYGDLPAHDGLWEAAAATAGDLLARLAVVPLVLEARGLDVTPEMIARLERAGDAESAAILQRIYRDEIGHVAVGLRWFDRLCRARGLGPQAVFHDRVRRCFNGELKPPFNREARAAAGLPPCYYEPLAAGAR
jgi:uncharacterized ferritin-like protein (DUF455 family)